MAESRPKLVIPAKELSRAETCSSKPSGTFQRHSRHCLLPSDSSSLVSFYCDANVILTTGSECSRKFNSRCGPCERFSDDFELPVPHDVEQRRRLKRVQSRFGYGISEAS